MDELSLISVDGELKPKYKKVLVDGMLKHHALSGHERKTSTHNILLKDDKGKILGGIILSFLWNGMRIETIWVDKSIRGQQWGTKLMKAGEVEGVKRGCTFAYTDTFTWQAPEFYKKLGYVEYGKLKDFPKGNSLTYVYKKLT